MDTPGYESLANILQRAYDQAATGKGAQRHACDRPFSAQPMQSISGLLQSPVGLLYQAVKKIQESQRLDKDAGVRELLGAINYLAGYVIFVEAQPLSDEAKYGRPEPGRIMSEAASKSAIDKFVRSPATGLTTGWVCSNNHSDLLVGLGIACPICGDVSGRTPDKPNPATGTWICTDQGNHKPMAILTGDACTVCFAASPH